LSFSPARKPCWRITTRRRAPLPKARSLKLKGPEGDSQTVKARNPANLKKVKVGDVVDIAYTEAVAIKVEEAPK